MNMHVDAAGGNDLTFAGDHFCSRSDDYRDVWLYIRITCFSDRCDASVSNPNICFDNSPVVENERVSDYCVDRTFTARTLRLAHAVANDLPTSELHLFAICRKVLLDFDNEIRVGKAHFVPDR